MAYKDLEKRRATKRAWHVKNAVRIRERRNATRRQRLAEHPTTAEDRAKKAAYDREYRATHKPEKQASSATYYATYKEELRAKNKAYAASNQKSGNARRKAWHKANPEKQKAFHKKWRAANPEAMQAVRQRHRARKRNAPINDFTAAQWITLQAACDHRCAYCGKRAKGRLTRDHIQPLSKGGSHTLANIIPACGPCNSRKKDKAPLVPVQPFML